MKKNYYFIHKFNEKLPLNEGIVFVLSELSLELSSNLTESIEISLQDALNYLIIRIEWIPILLFHEDFSAWNVALEMEIRMRLIYLKYSLLLAKTRRWLIISKLVNGSQVQSFQVPFLMLDLGNYARLNILLRQLLFFQCNTKSEWSRCLRHAQGRISWKQSAMLIHSYCSEDNCVELHWLKLPSYIKNIKLLHNIKLNKLLEQARCALSKLLCRHRRVPYF